ncbi:pentapeptide repeat-containing protein [Thetidibacter halocola]|uniref:Pentapeptide repeat-containing protein n=1 Tax=Thetidibacter halocola TaxID=2827239 RepID=A0A8J7WAD7_9RHOB|nr:pentapeptide repeat-containing protein [Thetidibacter halocola]MBS0123147.1 pentapeptide repeat-containing protein [Thetidibacter halocola]
MDQTVLPLTLEISRDVAGLAGLALAAALVLLLLWSVGSSSEAGAGALQRRIGLAGLPPALFWFAAALWAGLAGVLSVGLFALVLDVLLHPVPVPGAETRGEATWNFRFLLAQMVALTTVLGAVVALPITLNNLRLTREATETARDSLFNDKIAEAARDLHAQRRVTRRYADGRLVDEWEDDVTRRNAAIDRLHGLVQEQPSEAGRVSRLLSVYVRELSREFPAKAAPQTDDTGKIKAWVSGLSPVRSDMENAVQVLGRLSAVDGVLDGDLTIDLRNCNLQGFDLADLVFPSQTKLSGASCQGAKFSGAHFESIFIRRANFDGASFVGAKMQGARINSSSFKGANLAKADFRSSRFTRVYLDGAGCIFTNFDGSYFVKVSLRGENFAFASLQGSAFQHVLGNFPIAEEKWSEIFSDAQPSTLKAERPQHWFDSPLGDLGFETGWRAWQRAIGFDPGTPE